MGLLEIAPDHRIFFNPDLDQEGPTSGTATAIALQNGHLIVIGILSTSLA
jgi:hypothetical protein